MKIKMFQIWLHENKRLYRVLGLFAICLNLIFITGMSEKLLDALIYANLLFCFFMAYYTATAFIKFYNAYAPILLAIRDPSVDVSTLHIASMLPPSNELSDPLVTLLKEIVKAQQTEHIALEATLLSEIQSTEDYAALWAHEIKTPLSILHMTSQQIQSAPIKASITEEIERIQHLAEQFLYFSRSHSFSKDFLIAEVSLKKVCSDCLKKHARALIAKNLSVNLSDASYVVLSDAKWLSYIVEQLLVNAIKYTPSGGQITLSIDVQPAQCHLRIEDTGIGIDPEDVPRIFDRGFTGKTGRLTGSSTGMGLYLAQKLAFMLGHTLEVASVKDKGTVMTIGFSKF